MMATLGDLLGFQPPEVNDGKSFLPALYGQNPTTPPRPLIWAFPEYGGQMAIRLGDWKLIHRGLNDPDHDPEVELYDLRQDPREQKNLGAMRRDMVDSLTRMFQQAYRIPELERFRLAEYESQLYPEAAHKEP
jgi:arylsulfatase